MSDPEENLSISEFQKLNEYVSSSDESAAEEELAHQSSFEESEDSKSPQDDTSDEEIDVDINNLASLASKSDKKPKPRDIKDVDSLFATTKLKRKKEDELKTAEKLKSAQVMRHFAKFNPKKEKEEEVTEVTFKEWHVPLMEVPARGTCAY
ncbi:hypothetical protein MACK_000118 [Theileria orientalis]|uniref:Uncharacterized protein n=1 Tax=Theileria orientalis TaxID=68886 RepID=A0A976QWD9_THEOR|nr:hypothetical protein MACK_000118 [Theileria orientalis]